MDDSEYILVKRKIFHLTGVDLDNYKTAQVRRRLRTYLLRSGHTTWVAYFRAAQDDAAEIQQLQDYLTINVSAFFRDTAKFAYLQETVLPMLLKQRPLLRVWSAGCSRGYEPYSLLILLAQESSLYRRHTVLATDIDHSALAVAQAGGPYTAQEVAPVAPDMREQFFKTEDGGRTYYVTEALRSRVEFRYHNLLNDPFEDDFDLIVCRNVVIYFTPETKAALYRRFFKALHPGGVLFLGGTEIIPKVSEVGFSPLAHTFYRRPTL